MLWNQCIRTNPWLTCFWTRVNPRKSVVGLFRNSKHGTRNCCKQLSSLIPQLTFRRAHRRQRRSHSMPNFIRDVEEIRERAIRNLEEGAVTEAYKLDAER